VLSEGTGSVGEATNGEELLNATVPPSRSASFVEIRRKNALNVCSSIYITPNGQILHCLKVLHVKYQACYCLEYHLVRLMDSVSIIGPRINIVPALVMSVYFTSVPSAV
jgi:hypothetical protein